MREEKLIEQMYKRLSGELNPEESAAWEQLITTDAQRKEDWIIFLAEQYLDGELGEREFQAYLERYPQLSDELARQREVRMMLQASARDNLRLELQELLPPISEAPTASIKPFYQKPWFYAVAAAVVLLLALPFFLKQGGDELSNQELFAENFQPLDMRMITRGTQTDSLKEKIQTLYQAGKYEASLTLLEKLIDQEPENASYRLYKGICYIGLKPPEPQKAIPIFDGLQQDFNFGQVAQWYLALAYILDDKPAEGKRLIEAIAQQQDHSYRKQAAKLLGEMKGENRDARGGT